MKATKNIDDETLKRVMGTSKKVPSKRVSFEDEYTQFKHTLEKKIRKSSPLAKINFKKIKSSFIKQHGYIELFGKSDVFTKTEAEKIKLKEIKKQHKLLNKN